jgi:elongation factor G
MDITGADFDRVVKMMRDRLGANAVPLQLPIGAEGEFRGIIDVIRERALFYLDELGTQTEEREVPADMVEKVADARQILFETLAEFDDELMEKYLEGQEIPVEEIMSAIRQATVAAPSWTSPMRWTRPV